MGFGTCITKGKPDSFSLLTSLRKLEETWAWEVSSKPQSFRTKILSSPQSAVWKGVTWQTWREGPCPCGSWTHASVLGLRGCKEWSL